ncbi:MAG: helix-turn-helix transcriptional regulator [Clostridiales bacterium]|nr:helix-turn-helix transcriptional regulator [Clostridiales bacterium]
MFEENILGERVRALRKARGWRQAELGEKIGLSHKAISTLESGSRGISVEKLIELAYALRVSTDYLLGITDDPTWRGRED